MRAVVGGQPVLHVRQAARVQDAERGLAGLMVLEGRQAGAGRPGQNPFDPGRVGGEALDRPVLLEDMAERITPRVGQVGGAQPVEEAPFQVAVLQQQVSEAATKAEAAATQAQETSEQLSLYLVRTELQALRDNLERAKSELQETLLWESANGGENDISRERKRDLNTRIRETDEQIRCMVNPDAVGC